MNNNYHVDAKEMETVQSTNFVEILNFMGKRKADKTACIYLSDGDSHEIKMSFKAMDERARAIAAQLQKRYTKGSRAILLYGPGLDFIISFFGCLYAGIIAVPVYPPNPAKLTQSMKQLGKILDNSEPSVILTTCEIQGMIHGVMETYPYLVTYDWLTTDNIDTALSRHWVNPEISRGTLAFLQYTSGSTGDPKGVMVTHGNLIHNNKIMKQGTGHKQDTMGVSWLPLFHDMGLIGSVLLTVFTGSTCVYLSPLHFLGNPFLWLQAITRYRGSASVGPNFAYELCLKRINDDQLKALDLSCWEMAGNGAEPIRNDTIQRFAERFKPCGFKPQAFLPCYGMAEATLAVATGRRGEPPKTITLDSGALKNNDVEIGNGEDCQTFVSCGKTSMGQTIAVVDPHTRRECPGRVGEIWVAGGSVTQGYWNNPEQTQEAFNAFLEDTHTGPFLRTGDLGFLMEGELYITGRLKDLIIIRGRNYYPQDVERTVEQSHPGLRRGCNAVFSIEKAHGEAIAVVQEATSDFLDDKEKDDITGVIRSAVSVAHDLSVDVIVLIKPQTILKTSSGKIKRRACREALLTGNLDTVSDGGGVASSKDREITSFLSNGERDFHLSLEPVPNLQNCDKEDRGEFFEMYIRQKIAIKLETVPSLPDPEDNIFELGLDSLKIMEILSDLESDVGYAFPMELLADYPVISHIADYLASIPFAQRDREYSENVCYHGEI